MGHDSIAKGGSVPKDFGKKKRTNRLAKLKQCKLDARREQWLSQAKNKEGKEESNGGGGSPPPSLPPVMNEGNQPLENPENGSRGEEILHDSDLESLVNSSMMSTDSRKDRPGSSCGSSSGSSSISSRFCSGNFSEEEDDGCLDDWEAVADALTARDKQREQEIRVEPDAPVAHPELPTKASKVDISKPECKKMIPQAVPNNRAWRPDDAFRPQSLPNLSKQYSFNMKAEQRHLVRGSDAWARNDTTFQPSSCPICYEDLDPTDSSFMPCICGFRLCLFCHKKIFEVGDSRCPGCRRPYDPIDVNPVINGRAQPYRMARSCSMNRRSLGKVSH